MRIRAAKYPAVFVSLALLALVISRPAHALDATGTGNTGTTFTAKAGELTVSVPTAAVLGSASPGQQITAQLGMIQVFDRRGALNATWRVTVSATKFVTGKGTRAETIPSADLSYWSGRALGTFGGGTFTPGQPMSTKAQDLDQPRTAFSMINGNGNNTATFNPTLSVAIPESAVAGDYRGTVTHSVA
jgi:hypothetical protein